MTTNPLFFSIFSGQIYELSEKDAQNVDAFQIPLKSMPPKSCKKCHGRFYTCYSLTHKHYYTCGKCAKKCVDFERLLKRGK